jgi:DNA-binding beta-propeller fold protein YncE
MRPDAALGVALAFFVSALIGMPAPKPAPPPTTPQIRPRMLVDPSSARIFAGSSMRFHVARVDSFDGPIGWSVIGPGDIDEDGTYRAAASAGSTDAIVVASASGSASAASLKVVAPPPPGARIALVSCYDDGVIDARDAAAMTSIGTVSTGGSAAGIAAAVGRRFAYAGSGERLAAFDARTAGLTFSAPVRGSRFSEVVLLGSDYVAATDNNAPRGRAGVRIFSVGNGRTPVLRGYAAAGDTPEGIAATRDGRKFFVTNVNGNSVMRFAFDGHGAARLTAVAATGHRPFGVALDEMHALLFVADNDTPTVSGTASNPGLEVFSLPSMRRTARLTTGTPNALPLGVAVDATANRLFVTNEGDGTIAAYSVAPLKRLATMAAGRTPWLPAIDAERGRLYVPSAMGNAFSVFDVRTFRPVARSVPTCGYPTSIAIL